MKRAGLHCLLLSLLDYDSNNRIWDSITNLYWKIYYSKNDPSSEYKVEDLPNLQSLFYDFQSKDYIFIVVDGYVWKIKFDELKSDVDSSLEKLKVDDYDEFTESWKSYLDEKNDDYEYSFIPEMNIDTSKLFQKVSKECKLENIKLQIHINYDTIGLRVYKNESLICEKFEKLNMKK